MEKYPINESYWFTDEELVSTGEREARYRLELERHEHELRIKVTHGAAIYYCPYIPLVVMDTKIECKRGKNRWERAFSMLARGLSSLGRHGRGLLGRYLGFIFQRRKTSQS